MDTKVICIIPARGGSKGIPKKNIVDFCGAPLLSWSIRQAIDAGVVNAGIFVTSDSQEILRVATSYGATPIMRPAEISGDNSRSEDALSHAVQTIGDLNDDDLVIFLQATSPLRMPEDIRSAVFALQNGGYDSLFSATVSNDCCVWMKNDKGELQSVTYDYAKRGMRQNISTKYHENGSVYVFKKWVLDKLDNRLGGNIGVVPMDVWKHNEIDEPYDIGLCECIMKYYKMDTIKS